MLVLTSWLVLCLLLAQYTVANSFWFFGEYSNCPADSKQKWSYRGSNGPMYWGVNFPNCYGEEQSPIEIRASGAVPSNLTKLDLYQYDNAIVNAKIENNGHSIELTPSDNIVRSIEVENSIYTLRQLHFHWGSNYSEGSEHTLEGQHYALEMHLVHMNEEHEIAVVGVFFQEVEYNNAELQNIVSDLYKLKFKNSETDLSSSLNLNNLLPENPASYYRYNGSLTTPGCDEGVKWSVLPKIMTVGRAQMLEFRKLYSVEFKDFSPYCTIASNARPLQPLNNRVVYISQ